MATLLVCSRVRTRSLLTVVSAISARSSASSSSCWTFLNLTVLELTCSSWRTHTGTTATTQTAVCRNGLLCYLCLLPVIFMPIHMILINTHCIFSLSFVALDFGLKFINQVLHPKQSLTVFIRLQRSIKTHWTWKQVNLARTWTEKKDVHKPGMSALCTSSRIGGHLSGTPHSSSAPPSAPSGAPSPGHVCKASHQLWFPNS